METLLGKLEELKHKFPGKGKAEAAARAMGYPVLAEMLADEDGDGISNYQDKDYRPAPRPAFASTAQQPKLDEHSKNSLAGKQD
jgi:hypothetical protein